MLKFLATSKLITVLVPLALAGFSLVEVLEDLDDFGAHHGVLLLAIHHLLHAIHFTLSAEEANEKTLL